MKRFIITNPKEVVELGISRLTNKFDVGKFEVERDVAALIYYPCSTAVREGAVDADITAAFNYGGRDTRDGLITIEPERLIKYFVIEKETEEIAFLRFNPDYKEDWSFVEEELKRADVDKSLGW